MMFKTLSKEQNIDTLSWEAEVEPGGSINKVYRWYKNGNLITFLFKIEPETSGQLVQSVEFDFPTNIPQPNTWTSQPNNSLIVLGKGVIGNIQNVNLDALGNVKLFKDNSGNFKIKLETSIPTDVITIFGELQYYA